MQDRCSAVVGTNKQAAYFHIYIPQLRFKSHLFNRRKIIQQARAPQVHCSKWKVLLQATENWVWKIHRRNRSERHLGLVTLPVQVRLLNNFEFRFVSLKNNDTIQQLWNSYPCVAISDLTDFSQASDPKWALRTHLMGKLNRQWSSWKNWRHLWKANLWTLTGMAQYLGCPSCQELHLMINQINLRLLQLNLSVASFTTYILTGFIL